MCSPWREPSNELSVHRVREKQLFLTQDKHTDWFRFAALARIHGLMHAVVGRRGGISRAPFNELNLSGRVGDAPAAVDANRQRLQQLLGGIHIYAQQNHGTGIDVITPDTLSRGAVIQNRPSPADALITNVPGICLVIQTADCQAVMVVDPKRRVVANIHCGWRGSVADIIGKTVARMTAQFDCQPADMVAAIGPSLGPCCAEFVNYAHDIPRHLWDCRIGRHHFDFWQISRHQLMTAGLANGNVFTGNICTRCNEHLFYSYRAARVTGRMGTVIAMMPGALE